jgi:hypothetical protein
MMRKYGLLLFFVLAAVAIMFCPLQVFAGSQQKDADSDLAEQAQNPVSDAASAG